MVVTGASLLAVAATLTATPAPALADQLDQPTDVQVTAGRRAITATWTAPPDDANIETDDVHHYIATASPVTSGTTQTCVTADDTASCIIQGTTGLTANALYTVSVVACPTASNFDDCSEPSDPSSQVLTGPPAVPTGPTAAYTGQAREVAISWTQPGDTTGIETFRVTPTPAVASPSGTCTADLASSATSCVYGNLVAGTAYTFRVAAVGVGTTGTSAASASTSSITAGPPNAPGTPTVAYLTDTSVRLLWTAPGTGPAVGSYTVTSTPPVVSGACTNVNALTCDFAGLTASTEYTFTVHANGAGSNGGSGPSVESGGSAPITPGAPGPMLQPTATVTGSGTVSVAWDAPIGGATPANYTVTSNPPITPTDTCVDPVAGLTCDFDGLDPTVTYTFEVVANGTGGSSTSPSSEGVVAGPPILTVQPTVTVTGVGDVTITWPVPGGGVPTEYDVADQDGPIGGCQNLTVRECILTGLNDEVSYTFTVTGESIGGSDASPPSDAVTPGSPTAQTPPAVVATDLGELTLSWAAPTGGAVAGYTVAAVAGSATIPEECVDSLVRTCVISGLDEQTPYSFTVEAVGTVGSSVTSSTSAEVVPGPPIAPAAPVATSGVSGQIVLNWNAPAGGPVDSYTVTAGQNGVTVPGGCIDTQATTCTIDSLNTATSHTFRVTANAVVGADATSEPSNAVVPGPPGTVAKPTVVVSAQDELTVSWAEPAGGAVESYTVVEVGGAPTGCTAIQELECVIGSLTASEEYSFTVTATNVIGSSVDSTATDPAFPDAPGTPGAPTVEVTGEGTVEVEWAAPTGGAVTSYTLVSDQALTLPGGCVNTTNLTCTITDLDPAVEISFKIVAGNAVNTAVESVFSTPVIPGPPEAPLAPTATVTGLSTVLVEWEVPAGGEATDYDVISDPVVSPPAGCSTTPNFNCSFTGLNAAATYTFTVKAVGPGGDSVVSEASNAVLPGPPARPEPPDVEVIAGGQVEVTWTEPGGGPIDNYTVLTAADATVSGCTALTVLTCTVTALNQTQAVSYKVRANGPAGNVASLVSEQVTPGPPTATLAPEVTLTPDGAGKATISWDPSPGGGAVTGYSVTSDPVETPPQSCTGITTATCEFTGLDQETDYTFQVTATGPGGSSTSPASSAIRSAAPGTPATPTATLSTRGQATIAWAAPQDGVAVDGYTVIASPTAETPPECANITARTCVFDGLTETTGYTFVVRASNGIDDIDSLPSNAVIPGPPTAPGKPSVVSETAGEVTVSWTPSGGGVLTNYSVTSQPVSGPPAACTGITATTCVFDDLDVGTAYRFTVTATGPLGSTPSDPSDEIVPGAPMPVDAPEVLATTRDTVRVVWEVPDETGAEVTGYRVEANPSVMIPEYCMNTTEFSCDVPGLTPATAYRFRVYAMNEAGNTPSEYSAEIVPGRPDAPASIEVAPGDRQLAVTWTAPPGAAERVDYYRARTVPEGGACRTDDATETECVITGLENLRWYWVEVIAVGTDDTGDSVPNGSRMVRPSAGVPGAPTAVQVAGRTASAVVSWTAPVVVGDGIIRYTATATSTVDPADTRSCITANTTAVTCTITGLTNLHEYRVTVVSIGRAASGNSAPSTPRLVTPSVVPGAPTNVQVTAGARNLTVSFTPSTSGGTATGFTVTATGGPAPLTCPPVAASATSCVISGVTPGTNYTVTVVAHGSIAGAVSETSAPAGPVKGLYSAAPALPGNLPWSAGAVTSSVTPLRLNGTTTITGTGYAPNTGITIGLYPGAHRLATTTTDGAGSFSVPVTITGALAGARVALVAGGQASATSTSFRWKTLAFTVGAAVAPQVSLQRSAGLPMMAGKLD